MRMKLDGLREDTVREGDVVYIRGTVVEVAPEQLRVEVVSKTDQFQIWTRMDRCELDLPDLPEEPADGTLLETYHGTERSYIFRRDDAEGHNDRGTRRHDRHWWSYVDQQWVDWPYVVAHGGGNARILVVAERSMRPDPLDDLEPSDNDRRAIEEVLATCRGAGRPFNLIMRMIDARLPGRALANGIPVTRAALGAHLQWRVDRGDMKLRPGGGGLQDRWSWVGRSAT